MREIVAGLLFLACAGVATPKLLGGMLRERKNYPMLVIVALSSVLVIQVGYLQAIHWTNAGTATVLQSLSLLFVLLYVCVHGRRLPTVIETIGVILAVIGTVLIATGAICRRFPCRCPAWLGGWPTHSAMPRWRSFRLR